MTSDLKNNIIEKLEAVKEEITSIKLESKLYDMMDNVRGSAEKLRKQILEDPKYFFIPALLSSGIFLLFISLFIVIDRNPFQKFNNEATADLERRLEDLSKDTQEAMKLMLRKFKEEMMDGFEEKYGDHKFKKVFLTFLICLTGMGSFYRILKGSF